MSCCTRLTAGWQPGDGRTLFAVGDPMQSIYRFRQAEVGLFLRARETVMGAVELEPLTLACNFRSQAGIVEWINAVFEQVLPAREDLGERRGPVLALARAADTQRRPRRCACMPWHTAQAPQRRAASSRSPGTSCARGLGAQRRDPGAQPQSSEPDRAGVEGCRAALSRYRHRGVDAIGRRCRTCTR